MQHVRLIAVLLALSIVATACGDSDHDEVFNATETTIIGFQEQSGGGQNLTGQVEAESAAPEYARGTDRVTATTAATAADAVGQVTDEQLYEPPIENAPDGVITQGYGTNPFVPTGQDAQSTFALDVDTGSYTLARSWVQAGELPLPELVRVEEFVNFFNQGYPAPAGDTFAVFADGAPTPFTQSANNHMIRVGIKAREVAEQSRADAVLTFVVDVSGSMREGNRIEMVKGALATLVDQLRPTDTVAIVAYDTNAWTVLSPTAATDRDVILDAIGALQPGGSTNAEAGLTLGYDIASATFEPGLINRVILASDGVANVGNTSPGGILARIQEQASIGINLVTVGVGLGNYNDVLLEQLADNGDGFYAYVDTLAEAERLFVEGLTGTLLTVAEEAKVQVDFNPQAVSSYRLLGFENRAIADRDFRNDAVDAGEIGAGHEVTALYEVTLTRPLTDLGSAELATVNLRWREPGAVVFTEFNGLLPATVLTDSFTSAEERFQLDVVAAAYAEILRDSPWANEVTFSWVAEEASRLAAELDDPEVWEFAELTSVAASLAGEPVAILRQP